MRQGCIAWRAVVVAAGLWSSLPAVAEDAPGPAEAPAEPNVTVCYPVADLVVPLAASKASAQSKVDFESLIDLIELRTGSDCWIDGGGEGRVESHRETMSLVVHQSKSIHSQIEDLLAEMRRTIDLAVMYEVTVVEGPLESCKDAMPGQSPFGLIDADGAQEILEELAGSADTKILAAPKLTTFNGQTGNIHVSHQFGLELKGIVSADHRYVRVWMETETDNGPVESEHLIPDGYTAVRELAPGKSWMLVTAKVIATAEPEEALTLPPGADSSAPQQERYEVPTEASPPTGDAPQIGQEPSLSLQKMAAASSRFLPEKVIGAGLELPAFSLELPQFEEPVPTEPDLLPLVTTLRVVKPAAPTPPSPLTAWMLQLHDTKVKPISGIAVPPPPEVIESIAPTCCQPEPATWRSLPQIRPVTAESIDDVRDHLHAAAEGLARAGLLEEAERLLELRNTVSRRNQQKIAEIDRQIERLQEQRARLEAAPVRQATYDVIDSTR